MNGYDGTVLVTGATGNTAAPIVAALAERGGSVRGMVRRSADGAKLPAGAQPVVADFDDGGSISAALEGVWRTYLVTPSSEKVQAQQLDFVDRAAKAGVQRIVLLSQLGSRADSPVRFLRYHAVVEDRVRELGLDFTFLRPNLFFQGLLAFAGQIAATGTMSAPIGTAAVSAVDVRDIAEVAVAALTEDAHDGATYTLTGPAAVTHEQIAAALAAATGQRISFADSTPEQFAGALQDLMPPWQLAGLLEDYAHYRRGEAAEVTTTVHDVTGHEPRSISDFAHDYSAAFTAGGTA